MTISPPVRMTARVGRTRSRWDSVLRYGAAYICTLTAVAASQLVMRTDIAVMLGLLTIIGLPLSLWLRSTHLSFGNARVPRPLVNFAVVMVTLGIGLLVFGASSPSLEFGRFFQLSSATQSVQMLMQAFLIFGVCRCLAIINDKDAVLCTVPSFSVLLLLIVVHKGPEVVAYFLLWAMMSAILLALDHRADVRRDVAARVPAIVRDQEIKLSARGLAGVMGFSLTAAVVLSYGLSSSNEPDRSSEGWISSLASRLSQLALDLPDVSVNAGPERQIDFSSGPALPTRTELWQVKARRLDNGEIITPQYWRMFTLALYDGRSWSQSVGQGNAVANRDLSQEEWPLLPRIRFDDNGQRSILRRTSMRTPQGYALQPDAPDSSRAENFGAPRIGVRQHVLALLPNTGYTPSLPGVRTVLLPQTSPDTVRVRADASIDIGVLRYNQFTWLWSDVAPTREYGFNNSPPTKISARPNPNVQLSEREESLYLQIPAKLPLRVRDWAKEKVRGASADDNNYLRARRLLVAVQSGATYTLRPPSVPENRDATDFFLFDSRRGYCTYFAGALTIACRSVGIPARVVSGFTNPEPVMKPGHVGESLLRESGAHAWTEIWVPGWGWATLDATPPDDRGNNAPSFLQNWQDYRDIVWEFIANAARDYHSALLGSALLLAFGNLWWWNRRRASMRHKKQGLDLDAAQREDFLARREVFDLYRAATRQIARRYRAAAAWETTFEWHRAAHDAMQLRDDSALQQLGALYAKARYSTFPLTSNDVQAARTASQNLSWERRDSGAQ